jgi:hypothetical protein
MQELHPPVQPESTVLFSDADFHFMHLQLPELSRAQVRDVVHQLALSLRDLHANVWFSCVDFRFSQLIY